MNGVNGQGFGKLTINVGDKEYEIKKFDVNNNGTLEETELNALLQKIQEDGGDMFNAQTILDKFDANGDNEINFDEAKLWKTTEEVGQAVKAFDSTIAQDFVGGLVGYQNDVKAEVREFAEQYINNNVNANVADFTTAFRSALETQYTTVIKPKYEQLHERKLREDSISQITDDVVNYICDSRPDMSDTQIGRLGDWVFARATELVNSPNNYSIAEITQMIKDELDETPADMVNDEVFTDWEAYSQDIEDAGKYIDPSELANLKVKAKALLSYAMSKGIKLQQNGHNLSISQMENAIEQNYGGSTGGHALIEWINRIKGAITDISSFTKADLVACGAQDLILDIDTCSMGELPTLDTEVMQTRARKIIEDVMKEEEITASNGYDAQTRNLFGQALEHFANNFINNYQGHSISAFEVNLRAALDTYFASPIPQESKDNFNKFGVAINAVDLTNPNDQDIADMRAILKEMQAEAEAAGIKLIGEDGVGLNLNTIDITIENIETVKAALNNLCNQIKNMSNMTLADIIANNRNKDWQVRIEVDLVNGTASFYETPVDTVDLSTAENQAMLNNVIDYLLEQVTSNQKAVIAQRMKDYAQLIVSGYTGLDSDGDEITLEDWLKDELYLFIQNSPSRLKAYINNEHPLQDKSAYDGECTEEEWKELTDALKATISTYGSILGLELHDSDGNKLNANKILENFSRTKNPGELYDLIQNIQSVLSKDLPKKMAEILDKYPSAKVHLRIEGSEVTLNAVEDFDMSGEEITCGDIYLGNLFTLPAAGTWNSDDISSTTVMGKIARLSDKFYDAAKHAGYDRNKAFAAHRTFINFYRAAFDKINNLYTNAYTDFNNTMPEKLFDDNTEITFEGFNGNGSAGDKTQKLSEAGITITRRSGSTYVYTVAFDMNKMRQKFIEFLNAA